MPPTGLMFCVCFPSLFPWWPPFQPKLGASMPCWPRVIIFPCPSGSVHVHPVCTIDSCQFCQADSTLQPWFWKQTWPDIPSWTSSSRSRCIKIMGQCVQSVSDIEEIHPPDLPQFGRFRLSKNPEQIIEHILKHVHCPRRGITHCEEKRPDTSPAPHREICAICLESLDDCSFSYPCGHLDLLSPFMPIPNMIFPVKFIMWGIQWQCPKSHMVKFQSMLSLFSHGTIHFFLVFCWPPGLRQNIQVKGTDCIMDAWYISWAVS